MALDPQFERPVTCNNPEVNVLLNLTVTTFESVLPSMVAPVGAIQEYEVAVAG